MNASHRTPPDHPTAGDLENVLSARRIDVDDVAGFGASCRAHRVAESGLQAMLDAFGPLSDSLDVYVTV